MQTDPAVVAFESARINPQHFHHRDHLHVAWCYLRVMPLEEALARYVRFLRALVTSLGVPHKFHRTVTWRFVMLLDRCMRETPSLSFDALLAAHPSLTEKHEAWLDERGRDHVWL